jgi:hypothetical protein
MLMSLSEGSRESLRRLSSFTWMAKELLQVTDYFLSSKSVSIVGISPLLFPHLFHTTSVPRRPSSRFLILGAKIMSVQHGPY